MDILDKSTYVSVGGGTASYVTWPVTKALMKTGYKHKANPHVG